MLTPTQKADVLIEALGWIRHFRGKVTVIKLGGSIMEDVNALRHLLIDVVFMETVGMRPVIVHGGGAAINRAMDEAGLQPRFIQGRRYTDEATLDIVERVLAYETNEYLASRIEEFGGRAAALNFRTTNVLWGERLQLTDDAGQPVDLGHVGTVTRVDRGHDRQSLLCGHRAGHSVDVPQRKGAKAQRQRRHGRQGRGPGAGGREAGVPQRRQRRAPQQARPRFADQFAHAAQARELIRSGAIDKGMIPKVEACLEILDKGVRKVHIIDGRERHSLLLEIYTNKGVGTEIVKTS